MTISTKVSGRFPRHLFYGASLLISLASYSVYRVVLCAVVNPLCLTRSEYLFELFFLGELLVMADLAYLTQRYPAAVSVLPLPVLFLISSMVVGNLSGI